MPLGCDQFGLAPLHYTGTHGNRGTRAWTARVLHPNALSMREDFHLPASRYEISGMDLGWVWSWSFRSIALPSLPNRPCSGKGGSLKEREVRDWGECWGCSALHPGPPLNQNQPLPLHRTVVGSGDLSCRMICELALLPYWTRSSLEQGLSCVCQYIPEPRAGLSPEPSAAFVGLAWGLLASSWE